jgi:peroxiredoxin Q/BCP
MAELDIGSQAPDFTAKKDGGGELLLQSMRGKKIILYFYPKNDTSGCTKEACAFRDHIDAFRAAGAEIVGVSKDSVKKHDNFKAKYDLPFTLVSDGKGVVCEAYGVWVLKKLYGREYMGIERSTFLIDAAGVIQRIWRKVRLPGHVEEVLDEVRAEG